MASIQFTQIHPQAFAHPSDRRATSAFEQLPLFPELLKKISELGIEERFRAHHMHNSIKVSESQLTPIWDMVNSVAQQLCIPTPQVYVTRHGEANAYAFGRKNHSIILTSELVDMMDDEELRGVIAHEMGHILCQHMLYMDVGLALSSGAVPTFAKLLPGLEESVASLFFAWFRAAEYSADRAALLILEKPEPLKKCLCRLAGVPRRLESEFDPAVFARQAKDFDDAATLWTRIVTFGTGLFLTHPEPAKRVAAIDDWVNSEEYKKIIKGCYLTKFEADALDQVQIVGVQSCPLCRRPVGQAAVCGYCELPQDSLRQQYCPCRHVASIDWKYCKSCGATLNLGAGYNGTPGS